MRKRLILGIVFLLISYTLSFIPTPEAIFNSFLLAFYSPFILMFFLLGFSLVFDFVTLKIYKKSLLDSLIKSKKNILGFILVSSIGALILELIVNWSGKLWIYPDFGAGWFIYFLMFIPGFAFYWIVICESYLATKAVFDLLKKGKKHVTKSFKWEQTFFKILGIFGFFLLVLALFLFYLDFSNQSSVFIQTLDISEKTFSYVLPFSLVLTLFFGLWLILEYFQYSKKKNSLIKDILHNHFSPLLAIIFGSLILAVLMEGQNLVYDMWIYINWPLEQFTFMGLPILVFLTWPLHYILFLSLWRAFTDEQSEEVWKGDLIK